MKRLKIVRHYIEAVIVKLTWRLLRLLSPEAASDLGARLGRAIGPRLGLCRVARDNMRRAFPDATEDQIAAWLDGMWDNLGRTLFEAPHLQAINAKTNRVQLEGREILDSLCANGQSALLFSGHLANWEMIGPRLGCEATVPFNFFFRPPNNRFLKTLYRDMRRLPSGESGIPKGLHGSRHAVKLLKRGHSIFMLVDQQAKDGIVVPFFGLPSTTAPGLAKLALQFGLPAIPIRVIRDGSVNFRILIEEPLTIVDTGDNKADVLALMTQVNALLERWIKERPAEWLWVYRRWPKEMVGRRRL